MIKFCNFALKMRPSFIGNTEKIEKVEVVICTEEPDKDISFTLSDKIQNIAVPKEGEPKTVTGKMYLDLSREKIIFEGLYRIGEDRNTFWLEIDPDSSCLIKQTESSIDPFPSTMPFGCEDYPLSIGAVAFNISSAAPDAAIRNGKPQAVARLKGLTGEMYLHTILSENNREIRGINTCVGGEKSGFVGNVGLFRNKAFIDGEVLEEGVSNCYIYTELGESFLD
ncbi:hypothetical protein [Ruminiclostridium sufflavum]|uniref:hypothetical protein n=1 Tax=Ruminiclostridium sufflavum TaxID=396504 RepID=UPI0010579031|nr:hypothetical protein [Ruminiclostridium sufflavum]